MIRSFAALILTMGIGFAHATASAQAPTPEEVKASVPALDAMHEVIMPMWHDAWPKKDYEALTAMVPALDKHLAAVAAAELPGILREKQPQWTRGVGDLKATVAAYKDAAAKGDHDALLKAAEKLHQQYEGLVRVIRPVLREVEDFHASLYVLYHYQMEPFALDKASQSVLALKAKMDALNKATLPARMQAKQAAFDAQRARLSSAVDALVALLPGKDEAKIKRAIETMHGEYEALEKVFE